MSDTDLAARAQIPVGVLRALRQIESGGSASAVRFEPHVFHRLTDQRFTAEIPYTGPGASRVRAETNRAAFARAFALSPAAAVRATSWGRYQVLGGHLLPLAATPAAAVALFDANPAGVSDELLVRWFAANPAAAAAARALDFDTLAERYNGAGAVARGYAQRLREAYTAAPSAGLVALGLGLAAAVAALGWAVWRSR